MGIKDGLRRLFGRSSKAKEPPESEENIKATDTLAVVDEMGKVVPYACGHSFAERFALDAYGEKVEMASEAQAAREKCGPCRLEEFKGLTIRCALCGFVILPGGGIALYVPDRRMAHRAQGRRFEGQAVGCMRTNCCPSGGFFAGHWDGKQVRPLFTGGTMAGEVLRTGKTIVVHDGPGGTTVRTIPKP